jgi:hypothetical protein
MFKLKRIIFIIFNIYLLCILANQDGMCKKKLEEYDSHSNIASIGSCPPQCESDGNFRLLQFCGSTGYSWCVDKYGEKTGEERPPGVLKSLSCDIVKLNEK